MIKNLFIIAGASFVLAAACFAGAAAFGWHSWFGHRWDRDWSMRLNDDDGRGWSATSRQHFDVGGGPSTSRDIAWSGADGLDLEVPADVSFTQAPGPGKLTITGPKDIVDRVELSGSHLRLSEDDWGDHWGRLTVVLSAPNVHRFSIDGDGSLAIAGYAQDELDIDVSGHGDITGKGKTRATHLDISGDGDVDLGGLATDNADADISGSGRATIAPANAASLQISGSGEIDLLTRPAKLDTDVSGSGRIVEGAQEPPKS